MNNLCNRCHIGKIIDCLEILSREYQHEINIIDLVGVPAGRTGLILSLSRNVDLFERHQRELQELLDHPPRLGGAAPGGTVPGSTGRLDQSAGAGMAAA